MQQSMIKCVIRVRQNLDRFPARARRRVSLGIPQLTEGGRLAKAFHKDGYPSLSPRMPGDRSTMRFDGGAIAGRYECFLRLERLPHGFNLPRFEGRRTAEGGERIAEHQPIFSARIFPKQRMSLRNR